MNKPAKKRPNLYIVNLQWTPKDESAVLKIHGKCDEVMKIVMKYLRVEVPYYDREKDPIFTHATLLLESEFHTTTQPHLKTMIDQDEVFKTEIKEEIDGQYNEEVIGNQEEINQSSIENSHSNNIKKDIKTEEDNKPIKIETEIQNVITSNNTITSNDNIRLLNNTNFNQEYIENKSESSNVRKDKTNELVICSNSKKPIQKDKNIEFNSVEIKCKTNNDFSFNSNIITTNSVNNIELRNNQPINLKLETNREEGYNGTFEEQSEALDFSKKTIDCDTNTHPSIKTPHLSFNGSSSSTVKRKSQPEHIPPSKLSNNSIFSMDSILNDRQTTNNLSNNFLMAYYELTNTVLQNQMLGYLTSNFYPYQTSFLYPGLHSIINPVPFINYDFNLSNSNHSVVSNTIPKEDPPKTPSCSFCEKTFKSLSCLYYSKIEPKFLKELYRFSKKDNCNKLLVCVCCDYTTDEDEESDDNEKSKKKNVRKSESEANDVVKDEETNGDCVSENVDPTNIDNSNRKLDGKIGKIQAGWFGKGYRKNRRINKKR